MQDKPSAAELLDALAAFLREEVAPKLEGGVRFKALVGANVATIVAREIRLGPEQDRVQLERLATLLGKDAAGIADADVADAVRGWSWELCRRIDAGEADAGPWQDQVLEHLRAGVAEKLAVDRGK